jgi:hypothetical protein
MFDGIDDFGDIQELYVGLSAGSFGFTFYEDLDDTGNYVNLSYSVTDSLSVSYGDFEDVGSDILISYGFSCGSYDCSVNFADFSGNEGIEDEDSFFFTVSASL